MAIKIAETQLRLGFLAEAGRVGSSLWISPIGCKFNHLSEGCGCSNGMAMNPNGNPNIQFYGDRTRFGRGNDPSAAARGVATARKSLRDAQRQIMAMKIAHNDKPTAKTILKRLAANGQNTAAHHVAVSRFMQAIAMNKSSERSIASIINDVCGKLPIPNKRLISL